MDGLFLYFASYVMCSRDNVLDLEIHEKSWIWTGGRDGQ